MILSPGGSITGRGRRQDFSLAVVLGRTDDSRGFHLFDQPLRVAKPYEGYVGNLFLPREVVDNAAERAMLLDYRTHRSNVAEAIEKTYPGLKRENIHVWTLAGESRKPRLGSLWEQWREAGAHLVESGYELPSGIPAFVDSGSYAPTYQVGAKRLDGEWHVFLCDGYSGSAEAMQAASLAPVMKLEASLRRYSTVPNRSSGVPKRSMGV